MGEKPNQIVIKIERKAAQPAETSRRPPIRPDFDISGYRARRRAFIIAYEGSSAQREDEKKYEAAKQEAAERYAAVQPDQKMQNQQPGMPRNRN